MASITQQTSAALDPGIQWATVLQLPQLYLIGKLKQPVVLGRKVCKGTFQILRGAGIGVPLFRAAVLREVVRVDCGRIEDCGVAARVQYHTLLRI
jgi:hypothetical protein